MRLAVETLTEACGEDPRPVCERIWTATGDATLARFVDRVLERPLTILLILVATFVVAWLLRRIVDRFVRRMEAEIRDRVERGRQLGTTAGSPRAETRRLQRLHAIGGAMHSGLSLVIWTAGLLIAAAQVVDLRPILAGAGLAGLVIGFGAQNLIRDLLAGLSMLVEDQFGVGDWIQVEDKIGEVEHVGLRVTRIRDIDGTVWHVPNGAVTLVGNLTQNWARATLDVPLALDTDIPAARAIIQRVADDLAADPEWGQDIIAAPEIWGVQGWGPDGLSIRLVIPTRPLRNWDVNRQLRERLKLAFEQAGIRMPAPMLEVGAQRTGAPLRTRAVEPPEKAATTRRRPAEPEPAQEPLSADTTGRLATIRPPEPEPGRGAPPS